MNLSNFKSNIRKLSLTFLFGVLCVSVHSQNMVTTSAGAQIVPGISITETSRLNFGQLPIPEAPVKVTLSSGYGQISNVPSELHFFTSEVKGESARFTIGGKGNSAYSISLPRNGEVRLYNGKEFIEVVDFSATPSSEQLEASTGLLSAEGNGSFSVGASLKLENGQSHGIYSGTFGISVNYN